MSHYPRNSRFELMVLFLTTVGKDLFVLKDRYKRFPLKMDSPERVLSQAHGQARPVSDFLHENGKYPSLFIYLLFGMIHDFFSWFCISSG